MKYFCYNLMLALIARPVRWWLKRHPVYHPLAVRFDAPPVRSRSAIWVQACSLGEVNTARPLIAALQVRYPERPVLVTASTVTGHARAVELYGAENVAWFPFDLRRSVNAFLDAVHPDILVLVETELWPNVLLQCAERGVPAVVVNGRLSDRHMRRYLRLRSFYRPALAALTRAGMQSAIHAERLQSLGAAPASIHVTGNLKFDAVRASVPARERQRLRQQSGLPSQAPVLFFASTRPGDEVLAHACWEKLRGEFPELKLVIAPRHPERAAEVLALFNEPVLRRSAASRGVVPQGERVFLLDTLGEMGDFLSLAKIVVVGGSFYPGVGGHNPLEPAALGLASVFGPCMSNFEEAARILVDSGGAMQLPDPDALYPALGQLLRDPGEQRQMGTRARRAVLDNQGAVRHTMRMIEEVLPAAAPLPA